MNILTFDIEDWFHILDFEETEDISSWGNYESRLAQNMDFIFQSLKDSGYKATFFILGWIAQKHPNIIKHIISEGYDIGNHSFSHMLIYKHSKETVKKELEYSTKLLEDISGRKVKYFRAPGFSITNGNEWVFEILIELGFEIDSSIFPISRGHGGYINFPSSDPCIIEFEGKKIKELPINVVKYFGKEIVFSGGGYFRFIPYNIQKYLFNNSEYLMTYFHPRDFDPDQPVLKELSRSRKFKSYVGLKKSKQKFEKLLNDFEFVDMESAVASIDWNKVPEVKLG